MNRDDIKVGMVLRYSCGAFERIVRITDVSGHMTRVISMKRADGLPWVGLEATRIGPVITTEYRFLSPLDPGIAALYGVDSGHVSQED